MDAPIYIIGTERSGSNLIRVILNAHSRIDVPHPLHIMKYFSKLEPRYGDLSQPANLRRLASDIERLQRIHIYPWEITLDLDRAVAEARPQSLFGLFAAIQEQHLAASGKARWGNKSTFMLHHVDRILARDPGARLIWLVRDPRDVAVSSRKSVFSPYHPYYTARLWTEQQAEGLALEKRLPAETLHRLHYETLLADPAGALQRICDFLGEAFEPAMLRFSETQAARRGAALSESWQNTGRPILTHNSNKWRSELSPAEVAAVEGVCGPVMEALGYALAGAPHHPGSAQRLGYRLLNERWRAGVEWRSLRRDDNHWRRWGRAALMTYLGLSARPEQR